jgi:peptidoglycan/xylan/chitin deacetylase (PgdA/CDA1 family)
MILMYHKVDITPTIWWVSAATFAKQMRALRGHQVVYLADYNPQLKQQCVITFNDAYENVHRHALPILKDLHYPFEVFIIGDFVGRWNNSNPPEPLTRYCGLDELDDFAANGGRIQWHTRDHANLAMLDAKALNHQLSVPHLLSRRFRKPHFTWFAYPFGAHTAQVVNTVRKRFSGAVSVCGGKRADIYQINRVTASEDLMLGGCDSSLRLATSHFRQIGQAPRFEGAHPRG